VRQSDIVVSGYPHGGESGPSLVEDKNGGGNLDILLKLRVSSQRTTEVSWQGGRLEVMGKVKEPLD